MISPTISRPGLRVTVRCDDPRWRGWPALVRRVLRAGEPRARAGPLIGPSISKSGGAPGAWSVGVCLTGDAQIRRYNDTYRGVPRATDVLSFPAVSALPASVRDSERGALGASGTLGDLILAYESVARQARHCGMAHGTYTMFALVHGLLHLQGLDHHTASAAAAMRAREVAALRRLGVRHPAA
ncbi:MAG: rRNA maturation RNase YbeY [Pseudomonadota bacterium]